MKQYFRFLKAIDQETLDIFEKYDIIIPIHLLPIGVKSKVKSGTSGTAGTSGWSGTSGYNYNSSGYSTSGTAGTSSSQVYLPHIDITFIRKLKLLKLYEINTHDDIINLLFDKTLCEFIDINEWVTGTSGTSGTQGY